MTDDQLDRVYREFFRKEVPNELPPLRKSEPAAGPRRSQPRSRATLAVAITALLGLGLVLSGQTPPTSPPKMPADRLLKDAEADGKKILDAAKEPPMPEMP